MSRRSAECDSGPLLLLPRDHAQRLAGSAFRFGDGRVLRGDVPRVESTVEDDEVGRVGAPRDLADRQQEYGRNHF